MNAKSCGAMLKGMIISQKKVANFLSNSFFLLNSIPFIMKNLSKGSNDVICGIDLLKPLVHTTIHRWGVSLIPFHLKHQR
jgi:hypothetical protein